MTFAPTYEELLARNEKLENAVRDSLTILERIESALQDMPDQPLSDIALIVKDLGYAVIEVREYLAKSL